MTEDGRRKTEKKGEVKVEEVRSQKSKEKKVKR
jgi:hypothetical protein